VSDTLLATKIRIPPLRSKLVVRSHLIQRLNDGIAQNCRLTLISAPAGYGKSTLLSKWVSQLDIPVAWLSLEKEENSPSRFWSYFVTALSSIPPLQEAGIGESFLQALQSHLPPPMDILLANLLNELTGLSSRVLFVLDDLQAITEGQIHQDLVFLIEHVLQSSKGFYLVVASRMDPPWPLARWRVRDELTEVRTKDMRFTTTEATSFLNEVMGLQLSTGEISLLDQRTEGWIAGLQMAALSMQSRGDIAAFLEDFTGTHHFVLEYLLEEVLSQQTPDRLDFLLRTSLLEYLTAPLCNAITDRNDSQTMLVQLEKSNMFLVPMDNERRWYRYHHLFSELLRSRLKQTHPEIVPLLHGKACAWYMENGYLSNALTHAMATNDLDRLIKLVEKYAFTIFDHHQASTFLNWLNTLPETLKESNPWLHIARAWLLAYLGQLEDIEPLLIDAEKLADRDDHRLMGYIAAMWTLLGELYSSRVDGIAHAHQALKLLPQQEYRARAFVAYHLSNRYTWYGDFLPALKNLEDSFNWSLAAGDAERAMISQFQTASILFYMGRLGESFQLFKKTFQRVDSDLPDKKNRTLPVGYSYIQLSSLYYEWNNIPEALRYVCDGIKICRLWGYSDYLHNGLIYYAEILMALGDHEGALSAVREAKTLYSPVTVTSRVSSYEAVINQARGDIESAAAWVAQSGLKLGDTVDYAHRFLFLHYAIILQGQGKLLEAKAVLERLADALEQAGAITMLLEILTQQSIILNKLNEDEQALFMLHRALDLGKPERFIRVFTSKGPPMLRLLQMAASRSIHTEYINTLVPAFKMTNMYQRPAIPKTQSEGQGVAPHKPLSVRELEVLRLLDSSLTSAEIGRELYISQNTTRTHIRNIYSKLAVHSRIEAIQKAKEFGII
jgi:LuxR family maltose regulon positive regulatory protein